MELQHGATILLLWLIASPAVALPPVDAVDNSAAAAAAAAGSSCAAATLPSYALTTPFGRLPLSLAQSISPRTLFFAALADFAYTRELALSVSRQSPQACLAAWGAEGTPVVVDSTDESSGISHFTVFRTKFDVFVLFRGLDVSEMDTAVNIENDVEPVYEAAFYGQKNSTKFFLLRGFFRAYKALEPLLLSQINTLISQLPAARARSARIWLVGHSDGSALAQLAAPRLLSNLGQNRIGGIFLFGPQRVGSAAFADYYDLLLGNQTARIHYGWDPALEQLYPPEMGLKSVGQGFGICPLTNNKLERVVKVPLGTDRSNSCGQPPAAKQPAVPATARTADGHSIGGTSDVPPTGYGMLNLLSTVLVSGDGATATAAGITPADDTDLLGLAYLAHHMPAVFYDGLMRALLRLKATTPKDCTLQALQLPSCVISSKCSAALRQQPPGKCATCYANATCSKYWAERAIGNVCDNAARYGGALCYATGTTPPGIFGLLL